MKNFPAFPPVVYHGTLLQHFESICERILIDREDANPYLDFGKGFYTTTNLDQANGRAWHLQQLECNTRTGVVQRKHRGIVIAFDFLPHPLYTISKEQCKWFAAPDLEWAKFIVNNRIAQSPPYAHGCLWTYGPMADGKTNKLCHDYVEGHIDAHMLLNGLRPYQERYDQLVFHSEPLANAALLNPRIVQYAVSTKRDSKVRR